MKPYGRTVVDTNVFSYLMEETPLGESYRALLIGCIPCIACVTPEESYYGAAKKKWGEKRRGELEAHIADCVLLPTNLDVARVSGRIRAERDRKGRPISRPDAWIAATALWHRLPLVSHDGDVLGIDGLWVVTLRDCRVEEPRASYGASSRQNCEFVDSYDTRFLAA